MKTVIRSLVAGALLATITSAFASVEAVTAPRPAQETRVKPAQVIVSYKAALSARELVKYQQLEQEAGAGTQQQSAGAGMDTTTIVIIGLIVAVLVAAASGGGGGGGGY